MAWRRRALALHSLDSGQETLIVLSYPFYPPFAQRGGDQSSVSTKKGPPCRRPLGRRARKPRGASGPFGTCTHARTGPHSACEWVKKKEPNAAAIGQDKMEAASDVRGNAAGLIFAPPLFHHTPIS